MGLGAILGQMVCNTLENGKIIKGMDKENSYQWTGTKGKAFGKMISEFDGWTSKAIKNDLIQYFIFLADLRY